MKKLFFLIITFCFLFSCTNEDVSPTYIKIGQRTLYNVKIISQTTKGSEKEYFIDIDDDYQADLKVRSFEHIGNSGSYIFKSLKTLNEETSIGCAKEFSDSIISATPAPAFENSLWTQSYAEGDLVTEKNTTWDTTGYIIHTHYVYRNRGACDNPLTPDTNECHPNQNLTTITQSKHYTSIRKHKPKGKIYTYFSLNKLVSLSKQKR